MDVCVRMVEDSLETFYQTSVCPRQADRDTSSLVPSRSAPQKFDYDSSSVRKRFFREALLQIFIPYMLKQLGPSCVGVSPRRPSQLPERKCPTSGRRA